MRRISMKNVIKVLAFFVIVFGLSTLAVYSKMTQVRLDSVEDIRSSKNINHGPHHSVILKSRNSAVNVLSLSESGLLASSSGTYIVSNNKSYVLTVGHGIKGPCSDIHVMAKGEIFSCLEIIVHDNDTDYAIIMVEPIHNRVPINIKRTVPRPDQAAKNLSIQTKVFYTGYPNSVGPLTIDGRIAGVDAFENIYLHSFAWPGSSGSGVFNEQGKLIGVAMAVSVGVSDLGIEVLEDLVIVIPFYKIDWNVLL